MFKDQAYNAFTNMHFVDIFFDLHHPCTLFFFLDSTSLFSTCCLVLCRTTAISRLCRPSLLRDHAQSVAHYRPRRSRRLSSVRLQYRISTNNSRKRAIRPMQANRQFLKLATKPMSSWYVTLSGISFTQHRCCRSLDKRSS